MDLGVFEGAENNGAISFPKFGCFYKVNMYQMVKLADFDHFFQLRDPRSPGVAHFERKYFGLWLGI